MHTDYLNEYHPDNQSISTPIALPRKSPHVAKNVIDSHALKSKREFDAGGERTPKRIRKSNKLGKAESDVTIRNQTKPATRMLL